MPARYFEPPGECHVCGLFLQVDDDYAYVEVPYAQRAGLLCSPCWEVLGRVLEVLHTLSTEKPWSLGAPFEINITAGGRSRAP